MSSFPAQAARVRDEKLPLHRRLLALRECVLHFAPYGFRATWHHLALDIGLPVYPETDPDALLRAVAAVERARQPWLAETRAFAPRRRQENASGRRPSPRDQGWRAVPQLLAYCPDPEVHPREPLAAVVERLITAYGSGSVRAGQCPVCGTPRPSHLCPRCGARTWDPRDPRPPEPDSAGRPWNLIWHRSIRRDSTVGGGDIEQFRVEYTPAAGDGRFGIFQLYVRGQALGDATTTGIHPQSGSCGRCARWPSDRPYRGRSRWFSATRSTT